jgi:hypothetical protein
MNMMDGWYELPDDGVVDAADANEARGAFAIIMGSLISLLAWIVILLACKFL